MPYTMQPATQDISTYSLQNYQTSQTFNSYKTPVDGAYNEIPPQTPPVVGYNSMTNSGIDLAYGQNQQCQIPQQPSTAQASTPQLYPRTEMPQQLPQSQGTEMQYPNQEQYIPNQYTGMNVTTMQQTLPIDSNQWQQPSQVNYSSFGQTTPTYQNTYGNYQQIDYSNNPEMIQSHAKANSSQVYPQSYYEAQYQPQSYSNYANTPISNPENSYKGHPGYTYDVTTGIYQYSSGYQNTQSMQNQEQVNGGNNYPQNSFSRYTNASANVGTNQTQSAAGGQQNNSENLGNQMYYTTQYGLQSQAQGEVLIEFTKEQIESIEDFISRIFDIFGFRFASG